MSDDGLNDAFDDHLAAEPASPGPKVDHIVGGPNGVLVMFDDQDRVAEIAEFFQGLEEPVVVALVEPDAGLVEDIEHSDQSGPDLGREPDPLRLAARQRSGPSTQGQVFEPDVAKKGQPVVDFLEDRPADIGIDTAGLASPDRNGVEKPDGLVDRQVDHFADALAGHQHGETFGLEPTPVTGSARHLDHELAQLLADGIALGLVEPPLDVLEDPLPAGFVVAFELGTVELELERLARGAPHQHLLGRRAERLPRLVQIELELFGQGRENHFAQIAAGFAPGKNHTLEDR